MPYYKRVPGEKVYLSPISIDDVDIFMNWVTDPEVGYFTTFHTANISYLNETEIVQSLAKDGNHFSIITQKENKVIGNCSFFREDPINRSAEVGIIIGEKDYWGKGYGSESLRLLLKFGFEHRNFNSIYLRVYAFNERAISSYKKVGFKEQGVLREALIRGNKKYNAVYMDILADEYFSGGNN